MAQRYYEKDGNIAAINNKTVAIIGYGSQGHAHALNLRDSGVKVIVGLHAGSKSADKARQEGLEVLSVREAARRADVITLLVPDEKHAAVWAEMQPGVFDSPATRKG